MIENHEQLYKKLSDAFVADGLDVDINEIKRLQDPIFKLNEKLAEGAKMKLQDLYDYSTDFKKKLDSDEFKQELKK